MRRAERGFTLMEMMVVVAIVGILGGLSIVGLARAVNAARVTGNRADLASTVDFARSRAISTGRDTYVVFGNVDQSVMFPDVNAPFILVYDDAAGTMRANLDEIMSEIANHPLDIRERTIASDGSSTYFRTIYPEAVPACSTATLPGYLAITRTEGQGACAPAFCTFCEKQAGSCIGAIRFGPDGTTRVVTGPEGRSGGMLRLVSRNDPTQTACIVVSEPSGVTMTVRD